MIRVVIDTSVWIHYLVRPGRAIREILEERWLSGEIVVVTSPELLEELEGVLSRPAIRELIPEEAGTLLLEVITNLAECLPPLGEVPPLTRDRKDDKFVACAVVGEANFLISLDKDILVLGELEGLKMVTPLGFLEGCSR